MDRNLIWKTIFIVVLVIWAVWGLYPPQEKLKQGLDLAGGTSLVYEIDTSDLEPAERKNLAQNMIPILLKRIDPTHVANIVMRPQGDTRIEIQLPVASQDTKTKRQAYEDALQLLKEDNINLLKVHQALKKSPEQQAEIFANFSKGDEKREKILDTLVTVDRLRRQKQAERNMLSAEMRTVQSTFEGAGLDFDAVQQSIFTWAQQKPDERTEPITTYIKYNVPDETATDDVLSDKQNNAVSLIEQYIKLHNQRAPILEALTKPIEDPAKPEEGGLNDRWKAAQKGLKNLNLDIDFVREALQLPAESTKRLGFIDTFKTNFSDRIEKIDKVVAAYDEYDQVSGQLDDPEDLKRMLKGSGVLEFRLLPTTADGKHSVAGLKARISQLEEKGPNLASDNKYKWCEIEDIEGFPRTYQREGIGDPAIGMFGEKYYVLCSNQVQNNEALLKDGEKKWKLQKAFPDFDQQGRRGIGFTFDDVAATRFFRITSNNPKRPLCILLDNQAISAPTIGERPIRSRGIITGNFSDTEISDMVNKLNAGSFPARLSEIPISEKSISATIGADNRDQGIKAGLIGIAAVAVFMLIYYMLSGAIADLALMMNVVLVLGIMALLDATFTLPGIAGLILTIGMSVDANVLIFERIREEQKRGSSLKAAIVNGYQRAFRTIFDANLTTFFVAGILFLAASEEIKGFAIVLMLGIISSMFTALFVTRVVYDWLTSSRMITNRLVMLGMMQNVNVNWMAMRPLFLTISSVMVIGGLAVFFTHDKMTQTSKYDIEFIGGTSVEIDLKESAKFDRAMVQERINEHLNSPAKVYEVGDTGRKFEISTTETNKTTATVTALDGQLLTQEGLTDIISKNASETGRMLSNLKVTSLDNQSFEVSTSRVNASLVESVLVEAVGEKATISDLTVHEVVSNAVRTAFKDYLVVSENLELKFSDEKKIDIDNEESAVLTDFLGGIKLSCTLETQTSTADLKQRISNVRFKPDMHDLKWYTYKLLKEDLTEPEEDELLKHFVYVSVHPDAGYRTLEENEWNRFVENEKDTIKGAASLETTLARVTQIDPSIGSQSKQRALTAIILSLLAIVGYIWIRFGTARYGFAAIAALVHDVSITLGIVTACAFISQTSVGKALLIADFKINLEMIAAFLTIIGYSLNDTIVVFDRIRENRGKLSILTPEMISASVNQTLSRTLLTSLTTFMVVLVMYIWGGTGLRGFTFAMLIGIIVGTYSSVAIAAPILLLGSKKSGKK